MRIVVYTLTIGYAKLLSLILPIWTDKRNFFYFYFLIKKICLFLLKHFNFRL